MVPKKIIFQITPQTWVRATQNDKVLFRIPEECPVNCGLPRRDSKEKEGYCSHMLSLAGLKRKRRLQDYNDYKASLYGTAKQNGFIMPFQGLDIKFVIPVPRTWKKNKKVLFHGTMHQSKPDLSNLLKAFEDALLAEDKMIGHYAGLSKVWVDFDIGWIEVTQHESKFEVVENPYLKEQQIAPIILTPDKILEPQLFKIKY